MFIIYCEKNMSCLLKHLFIAEAGHLVHVLLLNHKRRQISRITGQEDDGEESPNADHDLAGGSSGVLHWNWIIEDQTPE